MIIDRPIYRNVIIKSSQHFINKVCNQGLMSHIISVNSIHLKKYIMYQQEEVKQKTLKITEKQQGTVNNQEYDSWLTSINNFNAFWGCLSESSQGKAHSYYILGGATVALLYITDIST